MSENKLPSIRVDGPHLPVPVGTVDLIALFLQKQGFNTRAAYRADFTDFCRFLGVDDVEPAFSSLVRLEQGQANELALRWRLDLEARGLAPKTVSRRLSSLRSAVEFARFIGRCPWTLEVPSPKAESYIDTVGPGYEGYRRMIEATRADDSPIGRRNHALLRLLHDLALRRAEAVSLDLADVDLEAGTILVVGKGKKDKARITIPAPVVRAIGSWLEARGREPGPLFLRLDRAACGMGRLTGRAVHQIVGGIGEKAALPRAVRPHGLRHAGITRALDLNKGDVRRVRKFSRHSKIDTLLIYDDNRADVAGEVAGQVSEE